MIWADQLHFRDHRRLGEKSLWKKRILPIHRRGQINQLFRKSLPFRKSNEKMYTNTSLIHIHALSTLFYKVSNWRRTRIQMYPRSDFALHARTLPRLFLPTSPASGPCKPSIWPYCPMAGRPFHSRNCTLLQWATSAGAVCQKEQDVLLQPVRVCSQQSSFLFSALSTTLLRGCWIWKPAERPDVWHLTDSWIDREQLMDFVFSKENKTTPNTSINHKNVAE